MKTFYFAERRVLSVLILWTFLVISAPREAMAQSCESSITLKTQAEVNAFPSYGCIQMEGTLIISGNDITNLDSLHSLTSVGQLRILNNPKLLNLDGLAGLSSVGASCVCVLSGCWECVEPGLKIENNAELADISGLSSLANIQANLAIESNPKLTNLEGLNSLTSLGGALYILDNATLTDLDALAGLDSVGQAKYGHNCIDISNNPKLTSIRALRSITALAGGLIISGNASLVDLGGLESLTRLEGYKGSGVDQGGAQLVITNNTSLTNIDALSALTAISATGGSAPEANLIISNNPALVNLRGLRSLTRIEGPQAGFVISNNDLLTDIDPLLSLTRLSGGRTVFNISYNAQLANVDGLSSMTIDGALTARIENNPQLKECCGLYEIARFRIGETVTISGNGAGCTREEISAGGPCETTRPPVVCSDPYITLTTQAEVDAFPVAHGCTEMTGLLLVSGSDITNVDSLRSLTRVEGLFIKGNPNLLNLNGLAALSYVGEGPGCGDCSLLPNCADCLDEGLYIESNAELADISGLSALDSVKANLVIGSNPKLTNLEGLNGLTSIGGMLDISFNATLTNLDALAALDTTGYHRNGSVSISIGNNPALTSIKGLRSITVLPAGLSIAENASLVDLQGLESLTSISGFRPPNFTFNPVTGLYIIGNISLQNIDALSALSVIRATGSVSPSADLMISNNPVLQNLNGLRSLTEIVGANAGFTIDNNDLLTDIDPLLSLTRLSGFRISFSIRNNAALANVDGLSSMVINGPRLSARIENNPQLRECCGLHHMVSVFRPDASITISGNGAGCTREEIIAGGPCENNEPVVCNGDVTLTTQAQVDAFPVIHACPEIDGNLVIEGADITGLDSLYSLTSVTGKLQIVRNPGLTDLEGLHSLTSVGLNLEIVDNDSLTNLDALQSLTNVRFVLGIRDNASLTSIKGLQSMTGSASELFISNNASLPNLDGLDSLTRINGTGSASLTITGNASLQNIDALSRLTSVGFSAAASVTISNNPALQDLDGLHSLKEITSQFSGRLLIVNNDALSNLDGLSSLVNLNGTNTEVNITDNASLTNINGLSSIRLSATRPTIRVNNNPTLAVCCGLYQPIAYANEFSNGDVQVSGNGSGCTEEEILAGGSCPPPAVICSGDITLTSQVQVNNFPMNHGCSEIDGNLVIQGNDITSLDSLYSLTRVVGQFKITGNPRLTDLAGLSNLISVGSTFGIVNNDSLTNLDALTSLTKPGSFSFGIIDNDLLTSIRGLQSIKAIDGGLSITDNSSLVNLDGLDSLTRIVGPTGAYLIINNNASLRNIDGLSQLTTVSKGIGVSAWVTISNNPALETLNGLRSLKEIIGGTSRGALEIVNNDALAHLDGLSSLVTMTGLNGGLTISDNASLANVDGLSSFDPSVPRLVLTVTDNPNLFNCCGLYACVVGQSPDGREVIERNGAGCTEADIRASGPCESTPTCVGDQLPQDKYVFAEHPEGPAPHSTNIIVNHFEAGIMYELLKDADSSHVAGPQPGSVGFFVQGVMETTTYHVIARNPETGCERRMSTKPVITIISDPPGCIHPADKDLTVQDDTGYAPHATYIYVQDFEAGIVYTLRHDADNSPVDGPKPGSEGLFTGQVNETTQYNVLARNPETGCETVMTFRPTVTILPADTSACGVVPQDKQVFAESDEGPPGMATNIIVINGEEGVEYLLRRDADDSHVSGPYPSSIGLYTGSLYETTTFNVLAINQETDCSRELTQKVTITIPTLTISSGAQWTDVMIRRSLRPGEEYSANTTYRVYPGNSAIAWTSSGYEIYLRTLLRFDLNAISPGAQVEKAELHLFSDPQRSDPNDGDGNSQLSGSNAFFLRRITQDWDSQSVTWNTQPPTTTTGQIRIEPSVFVTENIRVDITDFVQQWVDEPASNFGMLMMLENESYYRSRNYGSEDHPNPSIRPKLVITAGPAAGEPAARQRSNEQAAGTEAETDPRITLYPNPSNGEFDVVIEDDHTGLYQVSVRDFSGRALKEITLSKEGRIARARIDMGQASKGMYLLSVYGNGMRSTRKVAITD